MPASTRRLTLLVTCLLMTSTGCSTMKLPNLSPFPAPKAKDDFASNVDPMAASGTSTHSIYQKVREARNQNSVVLHVANGDEPLRVLPLPTDGRSVFVSTLLQQTGVLKKLNTIDATLFRYSKESVGGIPMEVRMTDEKTQIKPESDYALQPGDRLMVKKVDFVALKSLLGSTLGI